LGALVGEDRKLFETIKEEGNDLERDWFSEGGEGEMNTGFD